MALNDSHESPGPDWTIVGVNRWIRYKAEFDVSGSKVGVCNKIQQYELLLCFVRGNNDTFSLMKMVVSI